jgi:putative membrane protein
MSAPAGASGGATRHSVRRRGPVAIERVQEGSMSRLVPWIGGIVATVLPLSAWAQGRSWDDWGWHPMWGMWGIWGIGMGLFMLLFWVLVIAALVLGIRWLVTQGHPPRSGSDTALEILRQRYAKGEIGKEEFDAKKRDLS